MKKSAHKAPAGAPRGERGSGALHLRAAGVAPAAVGEEKGKAGKKREGSARPPQPKRPPFGRSRFHAEEEDEEEDEEEMMAPGQGYI